jgi:hypothetical protein
MKNKIKCKVPGCKRETDKLVRGLCHTHVVRLYRTGMLGEAKIREYKKKK